MSRRKNGRDIHGVLLLDKSTGISSNHALQRVKRLLNANKAGHTGALDPLATGMLPLCFGEATKFSQYLLDSDKRYRVIAKLGQRTDTSDADGHIIQERPINVSESLLVEKLALFRGNLKQTPTMFSALKHQGKPLYEYARSGVTVPREARDICVYELTLIRFEGDELELEVHCSKGTYIRTIIDDLGEELGCGAHVIYLRRLQVSKYSIASMITLDELSEKTADEIIEQHLMPIDSPVQDYPICYLTAQQGKDILLGRTITLLEQSESAALVRIYSADESEPLKTEFIGMGIHHTYLLSPKRLVNN